MLHREEQRLDALRDEIRHARSRLTQGDAVLVATADLLGAGEVLRLGQWVFMTEGPREDGAEIRLVEPTGRNIRAPLRCILPAEVVAPDLSQLAIGAPAFIRKSILGHGQLGIIRKVGSGRRKPIEVEIYDEWLANGTTVGLRADGLVPLATRTIP